MKIHSKAFLKSLYEDLRIPIEDFPRFNEAVKPYYTKRIYNHDFWSLYLYGDNFYKCVYTKRSYTPKKQTQNLIEPTTPKTPDYERLDNNISRAKSKIFEYAICNEFQHFCTFTLDQNKRDRYDLKSFRKDLAQLIRNINRFRPADKKIKYLVIPENHKNGAWHLHGLFSNLGNELIAFTTKDNIPKKLKNQIKNGENVYNFPKYAKKFGFFTATDIKDNIACAKYITKYITKDIAKTRLESGDHLYFASQGLKHRETIIKNSFDVCPFDTFDYENDYCSVLEFTVQKTGQ